MKRTCLLLIVMGLVFAMYAEPGKIVPALNTPNYLHVDKDTLIISENASFSIYSKDDMKLRKKVDKTVYAFPGFLSEIA